jgi:hypothetical protein
MDTPPPGSLLEGQTSSMDTPHLDTPIPVQVPKTLSTLPPILDVEQIVTALTEQESRASILEDTRKSLSMGIKFNITTREIDDQLSEIMAQKLYLLDCLDEASKRHGTVKVSDLVKLHNPDKVQIPDECVLKTGTTPTHSVPVRSSLDCIKEFREHTIQGLSYDEIRQLLIPVCLGYADTVIVHRKNNVRSRYTKDMLSLYNLEKTMFININLREQIRINANALPIVDLKIYMITYRLDDNEVIRIHYKKGIIEKITYTETDF